MEKKRETLLNQAFAVPAALNYFEDFPVWSPRFSDGKFHRIEADAATGNVLGCASMTYAYIKAGESKHKIALIGGVATAPEARGRGIASRLTAELVAQAQREDCAAAVLWGSEHDLYGRLGFVLSGVQVRVPLKAFRLGGREHLCQVKQGWHDDIFYRSMERPDGLVKNADGLALMKTHLHVKWFTLWRGTELVAFAGIGKGIDLTGLIHEWWGKTKDDLLDLFSELSLVAPDLEVLGHPSHFKGITLGFMPKSEPKSEYMCLAKILKPREISLRDFDQLWFWGLDSA